MKFDPDVSFLVNDNYATQRRAGSARAAPARVRSLGPARLRRRAGRLARRRRRVVVVGGAGGGRRRQHGRHRRRRHRLGACSRDGRRANTLGAQAVSAVRRLHSRAQQQQQQTTLNNNQQQQQPQ